MTAPPELTLGVEHLFCSRHMEPLRSTWPKGAVVASIRLSEAIMNDGATLEDAQRRTGDEKPDPSSIAAVLKDRPACCRLPPAKVLETYCETGVGDLAACRACGATALGAPFETTTTKHDHVCFECVVRTEARR